MIDQSGIQQRDELRASLDAQMKAYEKQFGQVVTQPIRTGDKILPFVIVSPDKPKVEARVRAARPKRTNESVKRDLDQKRVQANKVRKAKSLLKVERIRSMAAKGSTIQAMADALGIRTGSVHRLMREHDVKRGPQTVLEAI